jgi:hypothetical protein
MGRHGPAWQKFLESSLALWKRREKHRRERVMAFKERARKEDEGPGRRTAGTQAKLDLWEKRLDYARRVIKKRERQLAQVAEGNTIGDRAWVEAGKLVGVMEVGGNNTGKQVLAIIRANGGPGPEPWCGDFVAWCYRKGGSTVVQRAWAAVKSLGFLTGMKIVKQPVRGDIVCYSFDHTGLFGAWCNARGTEVPMSNATHIRAREGNTGRSGAVSDSQTGGDGVYEKLRPRGSVSRFVHVIR